MSDNVFETRHEGGGVWLPITEYSVKSGVSLSTIRRKIKSNSIQYKIDKGRYLLLFKEASASSAPVSNHKDFILEIEDPSEAIEFLEPVPENPKFSNVDSAVKMVSTAFEHALKEKEERIRTLEKRNQDLEARLSELKMLVQMIEQKYRVKY